MTDPNATQELPIVESTAYLFRTDPERIYCRKHAHQQETTTMKLINQNNQPITDPAVLPTVESTTLEAIAEIPVMGTTSADDVSTSEEKRLSPRDLMVTRLRNIHGRLVAYVEQTAGSSATAESLTCAAEQLSEAIAASEALPVGWKPARASVGTAELAEGDHVVVRAKHRADYQEDLTDLDMDDLVILRVGEKRMRLHCVASGTTVLLPVKHVERR